MKSGQNEIEKNNNAYPVDIDIILRCIHNITNRQVLENTTLVQDNIQNTKNILGIKYKMNTFPFFDGLNGL